MPDIRAVVFDLDDTLYPYDQFLFSGFRALALHVSQHVGMPAGDALRILRRAHAGGHRGRELQQLRDAYGLPDACVPEWARVLRGHVPSLRLPERSALVLRRMRPTWRIGVLTNGDADIQRRKVAALGLGPFVDAVVYATTCGDGRGKPAAEAFIEVLARLATPASASVCVGDDPWADMAGAAGVGMRTIHLRRPCASEGAGQGAGFDAGHGEGHGAGHGAGPRARVTAAPGVSCDAATDDLYDVPVLADRLIGLGEYAYAV